MCIIAISDTGQELPGVLQLANMLENNPHGAGFMLAHAGRVYIRKGYHTPRAVRESIDTLCNVLKTDPVSVPVIIHARIATHGLTKPENCHPFPVSAKKDDLQALAIDCNIGFAHNGIFSFTPHDTVLSDSMLCVRNVLAGYSWTELARGHRILKALFDRDKVVLMHGSGKLMRFGHWVKEQETGLVYSNDGFEDWRRWTGYVVKTGIGNKHTRQTCYNGQTIHDLFDPEYDDLLDDGIQYHCSGCGEFREIAEEAADGALYCEDCWAEIEQTFRVDMTKGV